jgi:hypothetical protein
VAIVRAIGLGRVPHRCGCGCGLAEDCPARKAQKAARKARKAAPSQCTVPAAMTRDDKLAVRQMLEPGYQAGRVRFSPRYPS